MADDREAMLNAMDWLLDRFEGDDSVAYAEVGGVYREKTDAVVTEEGPRNATAFPEAGVWCRVFAEGAADYRYVTSLDEESLEDVAGRAIRSGEFLAQDDHARFDASSVHRDVHGGWATEGIDAVDEETKVARIDEALTTATENFDHDRAWVNYADAHVEASLATTTGSTVQTTRDRASVTLTLSPSDGPKIERHAGSTRGAAFLDDLPDVLGRAATDAKRLSTASRADPPTGEATVVLGPRAAGQLFHLVSHYLEADMDYMGLSPYSVGDRIGPDALEIEDGVRAGSWAALAYDAELRPTTPVTLVEDGTVVRKLHNTTSAAEAETYPAGNAIPSIALDQPPRIHARHLEVAPGEATPDDLRDGADVYVERFDEPWPRDEFERVQRSGFMPPSVLYARKVDEKTVERHERGRAALPVAEGYRLADGERAGRLDGVSLDWEPDTLRNVAALGGVRETVTGVCEKHKSQLPFAVTAPGVRLQARLSEE